MTSDTEKVLTACDMLDAWLDTCGLNDMEQTMVLSYVLGAKTVEHKDDIEMVKRLVEAGYNERKKDVS